MDGVLSEDGESIATVGCGEDLVFFAFENFFKRLEVRSFIINDKQSGHGSSKEKVRIGRDKVQSPRKDTYLSEGDTGGQYSTEV